MITILAILGTIGFLSIGGYSSRAPDSARVTDIAQIQKSLDLSVVALGDYPTPDNAFGVTYSGGVVWYQGTVGPSVLQALRSSTSGGGINKKPVDPLRNTEYTYSELAEGRAYQIKADFEGELPQIVLGPTWITPAYAAPGNPTIAYIQSNYGGLTAKTTTGGLTYVLAIPSIITSTGTTVGGLLRIEQNALSGTLLFHSKALAGASTYNPNARANSGVVFSGASLPTSNANGQLTNLITSLKSAYSGSDIASDTNITSLLSTTGTSSLANLGTAIVSNQLGGKTTTAVASSGGGGGGGGYPGCDTPDITLANGQVWAACNVGATKAYTGAALTSYSGSASDSVLAYRDSIGGYFQWGRNDNVAPQGVPTTTLASAGTTASTVGHVNFIQDSSDWIATQNSNLWGGSTTTTSAGIYSNQTAPNQALMQGPCAAGYHVPTIKEWCDAASSIAPSITCTNSWQNNTSIVSTLKLSRAGTRNISLSAYYNQGDLGYYWASSPSFTNGYNLLVTSTQVNLLNDPYRANGFSVRCLKN